MNVMTLIAAMSIPSAFTAFCFWALERKLDKRQKQNDVKEEARRKNEIIINESVNAAIALGEATAKAVQRIPDAHCNGDMHAALEQVERTRKREQNLLTQSGIHDIMRD